MNFIIKTARSCKSLRQLHIIRMLSANRDPQSRSLSLYIQTETETVFVPRELEPTTELPKYKRAAADLFGANTFYVPPADFKHQLPQNGVPEFAFVGRSNVGKSSLIDRLLGGKKIVRVSKAPGCTKNINFFCFSRSESGKTDHLAYLIDLPGYGFAKRSKQEREEWNGIMNDYLVTRDQSVLRRVFILVDSRHGLRDSDLEMMKMLNNSITPYQIVFTKSDLVKGVELHRSLQSAMELMNNRRFSGTCVPYLHVLSSATGDGVQPLQLSIAEIHSAPWSR